jgi:hypothetical protein
MARVRVLAERPAAAVDTDPRRTFTALVYEDYDEARPVWSCRHRHGSALEAQLCGVRYLTDRLVGRRRPKPGAA